MPGVQCVAGCECAKHGGKVFTGRRRRPPSRRTARPYLVKPENLHKMSFEEVHERWPITSGVPDLMPDHVMMAILDEMATVVYNWRQRSMAGANMSSITQRVDRDNIGIDEMLGIRRGA